MNKTTFASLLLALLTMSSCKNGNSNEPQTLEPTITHKYEVTSSSPIELSIISVSEETILFNGVDEKTQLLNKDLKHSGSKSYSISSKTPTLNTTMSITCESPVEITYKWTEYQNGKETDTDTQKLSLDEAIRLYPTKDYVTSLRK